jgi:hypothetical protein
MPLATSTAARILAFGRARGSISLGIRRMIVADWDEYVSYAEHCLSIARTVANREARIILREMAAEWTNLAQSLDSRQAAERPAE